MKSRQYTIRGVPDHLDAALREEAASTGKSLNTLLIDKLSESCRLSSEPRTNGLEKFAGCLEYDPELETALREQRTIDPADWQ